MGYCKKIAGNKGFPVTSLSNLSHLTYHNILHTYIAKDFRHLPLSNLSHNYTWDIAKKLRQLPIKIVPFDFSLYTRLNIAKDLRQFLIKFVPFDMTSTEVILQKILGNFPIRFVPYDITTTDMILQKISGNFPINFVPFDTSLTHKISYFAAIFESFLSNLTKR